MATTVTIAKSYFEALLRRAELHSNDQIPASYPDPVAPPGVVTVTQAEYDYLRNATREYNILRNALFRGGLTPETLEILLSGNGAEEDDSEHQSSWDAIFKKPEGTAVTIRRPLSSQPMTEQSDSGPGNGGFLDSSRANNRSLSFAESSCTPFDQDEREPANRTTRAPPLPSEKRTLIFLGLSERTTHKDLVQVIRGGRLLDIYIRQDKSATVAFMEGAAEFLAYAKRHDIYIHQKRIEVRWAERQFNVPGHVAAKIAGGATRNLVVRGGAAKVKESEIRDHLEHIHNLVVIDVQVQGNDVYISTNSVHNALFARTCMMSRTTYKGLKIEWSPDECAAPIPKSRQPSYTRTASQSKQQQHTKTPTANLYAALLDMDEPDASSEEEAESSAPIAGYDGVHLDWADKALLTGAA